MADAAGRPFDATHVAEVDLSTAMLAYARKSECGRPLGIGYECVDAAELDVRFASSSFDLAVSCVALQDMPRIDRVFAAIHAVIRPGGRLVASITHPCSDTPYRHWQRDEDGAKRWLCLDRYFDRGPAEYE